MNAQICSISRLLGVDLGEVDSVQEGPGRNQTGDRETNEEIAQCLPPWRVAHSRRFSFLFPWMFSIGNCHHS